jgi:hypothetical protein
MKDKDFYLMAFYATKPRNPRMTHIAGYMKNPENIIYDEHVHVSIGLRVKDEIKAGVIINLSKKKVTKNKFNDNRDYDSLFNHYYDNYKDYLTPIVEAVERQRLNMVKELGNEVNVYDKEEKSS